MVEQNNWIDEIFASKWFLVEDITKVIRQAGYPEVYYEAYISTSPEKNQGHRLANIQRWVGPPNYNGEIERRVGYYLIDLHNAVVKAEKAKKTRSSTEGQKNECFSGSQGKNVGQSMAERCAPSVSF